MKKQPKFVAGALVVAGVIGYLMVTGMRDSMVYYYTPNELAAKITADASMHEVGVKVGGRVVPGTVHFDQRTLDLRFDVVDIATGKTRFPVHYQGPLPDTFKEGRDVVAEGKLTASGVFEASNVLTKCGSRYEGVGSPPGAADPRGNDEGMGQAS
ncbi:MAG TPA: cytochrome c maturation protein CcmE [Longimicrobiaceae bacterium]|nr:cytochrome c maturation protein CcmE [Longimicrobiaceae bacterium]